MNNKYEYDYEFWKKIDEMTWHSVKSCARKVFYTLLGVMITIAVQPVRLYEYVRYRWYNRESARLEREANERFEKLRENWNY